MNLWNPKGRLMSVGNQMNEHGFDKYILQEAHVGGHGADDVAASVLELYLRWHLCA